MSNLCLRALALAGEELLLLAKKTFKSRWVLRCNSRTEVDDDCPKHRNILTTDWSGRKNDKCTYPSHEGPKKKLANQRPATAAMSIEIYETHGTVVPIGSGENTLGSSNLTVTRIE